MSSSGKDPWLDVQTVVDMAVRAAKDKDFALETRALDCGTFARATVHRETAGNYVFVWLALRDEPK